MPFRSVHNSQLLHVAANKVGRDFAVGDIHGSFDALQSGLNSIGFSPEKDRLFSVGDLVDRGPQSKQVLQWLDQPWFYAICGNHDFMIWRSALGMPYPHVDVMAHGGEWLQELSLADQHTVGQRLAQLPLAIELETRQGPVGLVHADCPFDDWQDMRQRELAPSDKDFCLWSRERYLLNYKKPVRNIRAVVHGHTTLDKMQQLGNVYFIDTGGWKAGQGHFTFLNLQTLVATKGPGPCHSLIPRRYR